MPEVELCVRCKNEVDVEKEKFVIIDQSAKTGLRRIAHPECEKKFKAGSKGGRIVTSSW